MKKLKKGLSLLLVLAMVFSLASTAFAWETNYEDDDQIVQKEAVEVLSAMGIIEGDNGKFDPTGNFTREQAAKIVTYMVLGPETAESLQITANDFSDVAATRWSAKYIAYAASQEIVMGDGNGKFRPADNVSRIEWLKMLLVSLGVDPDEEGLGDDPNWAANTQSFAVRSGLVTGKELALDWNRDTAVLYAFNAMQLAQKESWGESYLNSTNDKNYKFIRQYVPTLVKDTTASTDEYGRSYTVWADKTGKGQTVYAKDIEEAVATFENKTLSAKDIEDLDLNTTVVPTLIVDGEEQNLGDEDNTLADVIAGLGGRGSVVEIYDESDDETAYKIVVINTYVAKVPTIAKNAKTVALEYADGESVTVSVGDLAKDDIVSFNLGTNKNDETIALNITKLEGVDAQVTATGTSKGEAYVRIDGEQKFESANAQHDTEAAESIGEIKSATFYYDSYGNILYYADTTAFAKTVAGYVYVLEAASQDDSETLLTAESVAAKAKIVDLATGATSVVDLATVKDGAAWYLADKNGKADETALAENAVASAITAGFYGYYLMDDGSYVLEDPEETNDNVVLTVTDEDISDEDVIVNKGDAEIKNVSDIYADSSTKLTVITADGPKYEVSIATGIANFSKVVAGDDTEVLVVADKDTASAIYVFKGEAEGDDKVDSNTYGMFKEYGDYNLADDTWAYVFVVNDEDVTYYTKGSDKTDLTPNTVYAVKEVRGDLVAATDTYKTPVTGTVDVVKDDYIVVDGTVVYLGAGYQTTDVRPDGEGIAKGEYVTAYISTTTEKAVYIVVSNAPEA
jgi:hypothetical protein